MASSEVHPAFHSFCVGCDRRSGANVEPMGPSTPMGPMGMRDTGCFSKKLPLKSWRKSGEHRGSHWKWGDVLDARWTWMKHVQSHSMERRNAANGRFLGWGNGVETDWQVTKKSGINQLIGLMVKSHISWENLWFPVDFPLS